MLSSFEFLNNVHQQVKSNPSQAQAIYETARDSILSDHRDAVDCAAALFDAATSFHKQAPSNAKWKLLENIKASSDRVTPSTDETRKQRALASLVAIWSWDVVCHYGWTGSSRTTVELLRQCALSLPDFEMQVAPLGRYILVRRHEESLFNSRVPSVGEHHSSSKGSLAHSPLTTYDIQLLASIGKSGEDAAVVAYGVTMQPKTAGSLEEMDFQRRWCEDDLEMEVRGKPLISLRPMRTQNFLLGFDRFGLLVPRKFAVAPSKRKRISARPQSRTGRHRSLPAHKPHQSDCSSVKAAASSYKSSTMMKQKTLKRKGENASKRTLETSDGRQDGALAIRNWIQIRTDRDIDRVSPSSQKNVGQSCAPSRSTEIEERPDSQSEVQQVMGTGLSAVSPAASEIPIDEVVRTSNPDTYDGISFSIDMPSNSSLANTSTKAYKIHGQHVTDIKETDRVNLHALDLASGTSFQRQPTRGVSLDFAIRQRHLHVVKAYTDCVGKYADNHAEQQLRKSWLRSDTSCAKIYTRPESDLGRGESATEYDADVIYTSGKEFYKLSQQGTTFSKPVVIKEEFTDAGLIDLDEFASLLLDRYRQDAVQVRPLGSSMTESVEVSEFVRMLQAENAPGPNHVQHGLNALDFHGITACSRPIFTRLRRYRLLETLCEADVQRGPGKRVFRGGKPAPYDVSGSLSFNILGLEGAFSGPHMDALAGTWVRNLCGIKFWMIVRESEMTTNDWDAFYKYGSDWSPEGKERLIVLEPDDVLFMPPGLRVIHAVHTPQSSLMEGGMLWDELNLLKTLAVLRDIGHHQSATNEAIPFQLPRIVKQLEGLVSAEPERFAGQDTSFTSRFEDAIRAIKELGCRCSKPMCSSDKCSCRRDNRRCTSFCLKHSELPPNSDRTCMAENGAI